MKRASKSDTLESSPEPSDFIPIEPEEDGDWLEIGPKNKTTITRDVQEEGKVSPISLIFGGRLRSVVKAQGLKASVTLQPFQSLQLDISVYFRPPLFSFRQAFLLSFFLRSYFFTAG